MGRRSKSDPWNDEDSDPGGMPPVTLRPRTPQGKIGRLPHVIREEVNTRLLNNEPAKAILKWLNALPETQQVCREFWNEEPVTAKNLSDWKTGSAYHEWRERRQSAEETKELVALANSMAGTGNGIASGLATWLAGDFLAIFEQMRREGVSLTELTALVEPIAKLADKENARARLDLEREKEAGRRETLRLAKEKHAWDMEKVKRFTLERLRKFALTPEVQAVLTNGKTEELQNKELEQLIFGDLASSPY